MAVGIIMIKTATKKKATATKQEQNPQNKRNKLRKQQRWFKNKAKLQINYMCNTNEDYG